MGYTTIPTGEEESDFYPYGGEMKLCDNVPQHYKFTGKERDTESGLDNFGARFDASSLGRFMSVDPVIVTPNRITDPQQFNRYAYVRNNPMRFVDPTGEILQCNAAPGDGRCYCFKALEEIAGGAAGRLSMDANGVISFNSKGLNLSDNEGATLINQLVTSSSTYGFSIGTTVDTAGGVQQVATVANIPSASDQTQMPSFSLPAGSKVADQVVVNPNARLVDTKGRVVLTQSLAFHELAEAFAKIDKGKPYSSFTTIGVAPNSTAVIIGEPQAGAHDEAVQREYKLREERPSLRESGRAGDDLSPAGGQIIRDPHN
jgi:RHS repeat-associated protein